MIYRVYVEKKPALANEARSLLNDIKLSLNITNLENVRLFNRYDVENVDKDIFDYSVKYIFSEPQLDIAYSVLPDMNSATVFGVEYIPGQFDQRADSAAQCIQFVSQIDKPLVKSAKIYALFGNLSDNDITSIKKYLINPVDSREADLELPESLKTQFAIPTSVETLNGFNNLSDEGLTAIISKLGLAMDLDDLKYCQDYFKIEKRDPTITEIKVIDTYWSDHCRHTTFNTIIDDIQFNDEQVENSYKYYLSTREFLNRTKPVTLMDIGTLAAKYLKKTGKLNNLDESDEINACTVKIKVDVNGRIEPWLLLFKNETHNHPTEIEPFGGAATCIGGAIRDPLSGRSYVYSAMRLTGAADPLKPISETIPGKLPQKKIVTQAANGYSSYGNQIGLATGMVDELYHPGYVAKRMEVGAVIAAAPEENVIRIKPQNGDVVILLGGDTGRDGIGGATGSSKSHDSHSVENCGAEVQKGNAPEERKIQRLFRNPEASRLIKKCNDFGAGGVSVAIGELAEGLNICLDNVPKKYEGLDGTELAISESQERMAVVVSADDRDKFIKLADSENLQAIEVAKVTDTKRLVMHWNNQIIVDISREFLDTNGVQKHTTVKTVKPELLNNKEIKDFRTEYMNLVSDLNVCSKRGLSERFDSTIGAGSVLMPFGGKYQLTPIQAMVNKIPVEKGDTTTCSVMSWGFDPYVTEKSPYHGAYLAVVQSLAKLIATGAEYKNIYLSFQEYFKHLGKDSSRWGQPFTALLGAFQAQMDLDVAAIGGKDSMSGTYENIDVPPTLISFAVTVSDTDTVVSPEFKGTGHKVILIEPEYKDGLPVKESLKKCFERVHDLIKNKKCFGCYTIGMGGIAEAIYKMCIGNGLGFRFNESVAMNDLFTRKYGAFILEVQDDVDGKTIGITNDSSGISYGNENITLKDLYKPYEDKLESVFSCNLEINDKNVINFEYHTENKLSPSYLCAKPHVLIPVFPGTNCEYDSAKAVEKAGCEAEIFIVKNRSKEDIKRSIESFTDRINNSQILFIPGGFSGGDEPDGSAKFIISFMKNSSVKSAITSLLDNREGLICGICNGFQALIKLGLVPYGRIIETDENCPTLTFNSIQRHQSKIVHTRICSNKSPWLSLVNVGEIYDVPISHGEGRFIADEKLIKDLASNGQIATQYVDLEGNATYDIRFNPNSSTDAIEGITSPDGRVFGKMGHSERVGDNLYKNVPGQYFNRMFESARRYFNKV